MIFSLLAACDSSVLDRLSFTEAAEGKALVEVEAVDGDLVAVGSDRNDVKVTAILRVTDDDLFIDGVFADEIVNFGMDPFGDRWLVWAYLYDEWRWGMDVDLVLRVPHDYGITAFGVSGSTEIRKTGPVEVVDGGGAVVIKHITGDVGVWDEGGRVKIVDVAGNVYVEDEQGRIVVKHVSNDVTIVDGAGTIKVVDVDGLVTIEDEKGRVVLKRVAESVVIED